MSDFGEEYTHVALQCDSTSAISVAKNPVLHSKTKHIEVRYHFLRDNVEKGKITFFFEKHCGGDPHSIKTLINEGKEKVYLQIN
jgi:hypothetical protein